ncbi:MAG TPA: phosphoribosyltransferase family protein [Aldersonia sp.]
MIYSDRAEAGRALAEALRDLDADRPLVLGLPRGGVPVAKEVATALHADLDIALVRKLGVPWQPELAMGAIGEGGVRILNDDVIARAGVTAEQLRDVEAGEHAELERRARVLRGHRRRIDPRGRVVVVVDDGMATGATAAAGAAVAHTQGAARVIVAVPVAPPDAIARLREHGAGVDAVVCPYIPRDLGGVGAAYADFHQLTDTEVRDLLLST